MVKPIDPKFGKVKQLPNQGQDVGCQSTPRLLLLAANRASSPDVLRQLVDDTTLQSLNGMTCSVVSEPFRDLQGIDDTADAKGLQAPVPTLDRCYYMFYSILFYSALYYVFLCYVVLLYYLLLSYTI